MTSQIPLQLGIRAHDLPKQPLHHLTQQLTEFGMSNIQLAINKSFPEAIPDISKTSFGAAQFLARELNRANIHVMVLGCYINLSSNNPHIREKALAKFKRHIELAPTFAASFVATETGSVKSGYTTENFTNEAYQQMLTSVVSLVQHAEAIGQNIAIEPGINHPLYDLTVVKRLFSDIQSPRLKLILDFYNLLTPENFQKQEYLMDEALNSFGDVLEVFHFKDFTLKNGQITPVPAGQGQMNFKPQLEFIKYQKPGLFTSLEGHTGDTILPAKTFLHETYQLI